MRFVGVRSIGLAVGALALSSVLLAGCGVEEAAPTATPTQAAPIATPTMMPKSAAHLPTATPTTAPAAATATPTTAQAAPSPASTPTRAAPTPTQAPAPAPVDRAVGEVDGVAFVVGEGSEATFTVTEQLANLSLPNDAVMRTTGLSGEVRLDGGASEVAVDLHSMTSDSSGRDGYVRYRMFPNQRSATVRFGDLRPLPDGFTDGVEVSTSATGELSINDIVHPLVFEIEARDDGDVVFVVGRTTFTWADIGMPRPSARIVVSVEDEVRVEVLLALRPG